MTLRAHNYEENSGVRREGVWGVGAGGGGVGGGLYLWRNVSTSGLMQVRLLLRTTPRTTKASTPDRCNICSAVYQTQCTQHVQRDVPRCVAQLRPSVRQHAFRYALYIWYKPMHTRFATYFTIMPHKVCNACYCYAQHKLEQNVQHVFHCTLHTTSETTCNWHNTSTKDIIRCIHNTTDTTQVLRT